MSEQVEAQGQNAEAAELRKRVDDAERELVLRRALQGIDWFDPEDAYRELAARTERDAEGKWVVLAPSPQPSPRGREGSVARAETPVLPDQAARELAASKPHWVRARVLGGTGAGSGSGGAAGQAAGVTYADLLKPENAEKLREYLHDRPEDLERLRQAHFGL